MGYVADRYSRAITSSNLRVQHRTQGDGDILVAAGAAVRRTRGTTSLAAMLYRLRVEFDKVDKRSLARHDVSLTAILLAYTHIPSLHGTREAMSRFVEGEARRSRYEVSEKEVEAVVDRVLDHFLDPICAACRGVKFKVVTGTGRLSGVVCGSCLGTGQRWLPYAPDAQHCLLPLTQQVRDAMTRKMQKFDQRVGRLLKV